VKCGASQDFLREIVVVDHSDETACGKKRVSGSIGTSANARTNEAGEYLAILGDIDAKEFAREAMIFERAEKKQAVEAVIVARAFEDIARERCEYSFLFASAGIFQGAGDGKFQLVAAGSAAHHIIEDRPVEDLFIAKVAEDDCFVDVSALCDLLGGGTAKTALGKKRSRNCKKLSAAVVGRNSRFAGGHVSDHLPETRYLSNPARAGVSMLRIRTICREKLWRY
jgi:hypothetical protein